MGSYAPPAQPHLETTATVPPGAISNAAGNSNYRSSPGSHPHQCSGSISVNSLTTPKLTEIVTAAAGDKNDLCKRWIGGLHLERHLALIERIIVSL